MKLVIVILFLFNLLSAQKEDYQWIFNDSQFGIDSSLYPETAGASILDFNYDPPRFYRDSVATLDLDWTHASVCDKEGQLLFYSNGMRISNGRSHKPLIGAERISYGPKWEVRTELDEFGVQQPYGFAYQCSNIFLPYPGNDDEYFHIYVNYDERAITGYVSKLFCEIEKVSSEDFEVTRKDVLINDKIITQGVTSCVQHAN